MKIGLYGGLANNCYVFAKELHHFGSDVLFIRDRTDGYAFSQPVWEDASFVMEYADVANSAALTKQEWQEIENEQGWSAPSWYKDPLPHSENAFDVELNNPFLKILATRYIKQWPHRSAVLGAMKSCDVLLVCGIEGTILAMASGRPYVIWPHGGDIRMAAGLVKPPVGLRQKISFQIQKQLLLAAYDHSFYVGTHDANGLAGANGSTSQALHRTSLKHLPIPIAPRERLTPEARMEKRKQLCEELGVKIPLNKVIGFIPSRIDYYWKGQDLLLEGLTKLPNKENLHLIFTGWGSDYQDAKDFVSKHDLGNIITFLPCSLSKPLLANFFSSVDFTVDQFRYMGTYGTAMVEALSHGCPTLMWINESFYKARGWQAPPVINAKSKDEIIAKLEGIASGDINLEETSKQSLEWIAAEHSPSVVCPKLIDRFKKHLNGKI